MKSEKTTVLINTDKETKRQASEIYRALGMNLTTAVNIFFRQTVLQQRFPCTIDTSVFPDIKSSYPDGFFELFGAGKGLGFDEEPEELPLDTEDITL